MNHIMTKIGVAGTTSLILSESLNLNTIYNALITLAVSIITVLTAEGIAWLKAWFKKKKAKEEAEQHKYEEEDLVTHAIEIDEEIKDKEE